MIRQPNVKYILTAFAETRNVVRWSLAQEQRKFAVAVEEKVSSDALEIKKSPKRVSKNERRAMVESFVNKYYSIVLDIYLSNSFWLQRYLL